MQYHQRHRWAPLFIDEEQVERACAVFWVQCSGRCHQTARRSPRCNRTSPQPTARSSISAAGSMVAATDTGRSNGRRREHARNVTSPAAAGIHAPSSRWARDWISSVCRVMASLVTGRRFATQPEEQRDRRNNVRVTEASSDSVQSPRHGDPSSARSGLAAVHPNHERSLPTRPNDDAIASTDLSDRRDVPDKTPAKDEAAASVRGRLAAALV